METGINALSDFTVQNMQNQKLKASWFDFIYINLCKSEIIGGLMNDVLIIPPYYIVLRWNNGLVLNFPAKVNRIWQKIPFQANFKNSK